MVGFRYFPLTGLPNAYQVTMLPSYPGLPLTQLQTKRVLWGGLTMHMLHTRRSLLDTLSFFACLGTLFERHHAIRTEHTDFTCDIKKGSFV